MVTGVDGKRSEPYAEEVEGGQRYETDIQKAHTLVHPVPLPPLSTISLTRDHNMYTRDP